MLGRVFLCGIVGLARPLPHGRAVPLFHDVPSSPKNNYPAAPLPFRVEDALTRCDSRLQATVRRTSTNLARSTSGLATIEDGPSPFRHLDSTSTWTIPYHSTTNNLHGTLAIPRPSMLTLPPRLSDVKDIGYVINYDMVRLALPLSRLGFPTLTLLSCRSQPNQIEGTHDVSVLLSPGSPANDRFSPFAQTTFTVSDVPVVLEPREPLTRTSRPTTVAVRPSSPPLRSSRRRSPLAPSPQRSLVT